MTIETEPATPRRRSKRGQPIVNFPSATSSQVASIIPSPPIFTRPSTVNDLLDAEALELGCGDIDLKDVIQPGLNRGG